MGISLQSPSALLSPIGSQPPDVMSGRLSLCNGAVEVTAKCFSLGEARASPVAVEPNPGFSDLSTNLGPFPTILRKEKHVTAFENSSNSAYTAHIHMIMSVGLEYTITKIKMFLDQGAIWEPSTRRISGINLRLIVALLYLEDGFIRQIS